MKQRPYYMTTFFVEGLMTFPFDMLRYDSCCPALENDSHTMNQEGKLRRVCLRRFSPDKKAHPSYARWLAFGWKASEPVHEET